jgi:polyphosphate glucokinase
MHEGEIMEIFGMDVGGSGIKGAPVDVESGEMTAERFRLPTPEQALPVDVSETLHQVLEHFHWSGPVGVGFPGVIQNGVVRTAANIHPTWIGTNGAELFYQTSGCPTYLVNDGDAAGMGEMAFGAGRDQKGVVLMITVGTGIGTALFTDGILVPNTELGHIEIRGKDAERRSSDATRQRKDLSWDRWGARLSEHLERLENLFWPDLIIIGGGISKTPEKFFPYLRLRTRVVPAQMQNQAGTVGAALFAKKFI